MLGSEMKGEPNLVTGQLENGFRYVILPNKLPPKRFEAHLEVHVGSVDELPNEQGIAHLVEHVTFLGSKRRENLLGTGARANAYTDFHHTVFHVHAPVTNGVTGSPMLPQVLEALEEIAFRPEFLATRIEKERKAVMAEAQMMNTIEYRVDCQLLQYLHYENNLGCRFPIGKMDQVKAWPHDAVKAYWSRWYFPANATLYVVGDLDRDIEATRALIRSVFGRLQPATMSAEEAAACSAASKAAADGHQPPHTLPAPASMVAALSKGNGNGTAAAVAPEVAPDPAAAAAALLLKARHPIRPPVRHHWGMGPLAPAERPAPVSTFQHPLLQNFMLSVFCKVPITPMTTMAHLRQLLMIRTILSVFQFRVTKRYVAADPPFIGIELDISDSGREGATVSTLSVTSEPNDWQGAVRVAVEEVRRLQRYGLTKGELERYSSAILRDSAQLAEQANKVPSLDTLNFVMESLACGHTVMGHREAHEAMCAVAATVTLEEINSLARSLLTFASDYGSEGEALAEAAAAPPGAYVAPGPTRATSIVACLPAWVDANGASISVSSGGADASARGAAGHMGAGGHIDPDTVDLDQLAAQAAQVDAVEVPEGAFTYAVTADMIAGALADRAYEVEPPLDVDCPDFLMSEEEVSALVAERNPHYVPLAEPGTSGDAFPEPGPNGIVQRRLSNGMRLNYRVTDNEPRAALLRMIAPGGSCMDKLGAAPDGYGAVTVGMRTLSEAGAVGKWDREQVMVYCVSNLINCAMEADEENLCVDFHFAVGDGSMERTFQLAHLLLEQPRWEEAAADRAKTAFASASRSVSKSLDRATADRIMSVMMGGPEVRRFREPSPEEIDALTLEGMRNTVMGLLHAGALEINVVGDFDAQELERLVATYLGTVAPRPPTAVTPIIEYPVVWQDPTLERRHSSWHLHDSDERAAAYVAGPAPPRWGPFGSGDPIGPYPHGEVVPPPVVVPGAANSAEARQAATDARRRHPLFSSAILMLLTEVINSRLFTTVRDSLGLTYDVSFQFTMFDRVRLGWFSVLVTSHPDKIYDALDASVAVLRDMAVSPVNRRELARARTTLITRHESDMKDNAYWLGLLTHLQNEHVPWKVPECLRDLRAMYEAITVDDLYHAYSFLQLSDQQLFTCVGTSGKSAPPPPEGRVLGGVLADDEGEGVMLGQGGEGAQGQGGQLPNPMALFTAMLAAAQAMNPTVKAAVQQGQSSAGQQQQAGSSGSGSGPAQK